MKKKLICTVLLALTCYLIFSQEIFSNNKAKYLFIGSIKKDSIKVLANGKIEWIKNENLHQLDKLSTKDFLNKIFSQKLKFEMEGYEPFWNAKIYKNVLFFTDPVTGNEKKYNINYNYNINKVDSGVYFSFSDTSHKIHGYINYIGLENVKNGRICEYNLSEENTLYETFITVDGVIYKGCSVIIK
ncbi:hypothetical protein [Chryseobacterium luquanense]|uniref:Uncharacterized protein n=1 Tax=Chryseobacterium luquanense TaxID=2983766 RepID=A0ABT3Y4X8_9FLAO|nr:hypothetical protein [Chryseobacterium luquanense]MCX8533198.1 hypothetical protein [Chryseobacterium luquanense]